MNWLYFSLAGIVGGILGGMGMGGGTLIIPILSILLKVEQHTAQAVNLISFIPMSILAILIHKKNNILETKGILPIIISAVVTTAICSYLATLISNEVLKRIFGAFLMVFSIVEFIVGWKKNKKTKVSKTAIRNAKSF